MRSMVSRTSRIRDGQRSLISVHQKQRVSVGTRRSKLTPTSSPRTSMRIWLGSSGRNASMLKTILLTVTAGLGVCLSQADRAGVTGTISDPTHLPVAVAHVRLVYPNTWLQRET